MIGVKWQPSWEDEAKAEAAKTEALNRVEKNASASWKRDANYSLDHVIASGRTGDPTFTSDDVWGFLENCYQAWTHEPRAMGAILRQAAREGRIRKTNRVVNSRRVECHQRPVAVWEVVR